MESDMCKKKKKVIIKVTQLWIVSHSSHLPVRYVHWFSSGLDFMGVTHHCIVEFKGHSIF